MAITVKHKFVSAVPDSTDTSLVRPSSWNDTHDITGLGTAAALDAGVANGVATLDSAGKVPVSQMPQMGDLNYQGTWNATTNSPTLVSSTGTKGYYYVVSVAGTTNLNGITDWKIGDWAVFNGTAWEKIDNTDSVTSVNGYTGAVVLGYADVGAFPATSTTGTGNVVLQTSPTINTPTLSGPTVDGTAPYVNMTPTTAPAYQEGRLFYDSSSGTLAYYNDNTQMTVNIGQEQIVKVRNQTGASIPNGTVVYVNGATGNTPTINLALATSFVTADIIGVTTTTIANNGFGYATISGLVNGLDTSAFAEGASVFISPTVAGAYTATEPVAPNYSVQVGVILRSNPSNGTLLVSVQFISTEASHIVGQIPVSGGGTGLSSVATNRIPYGNGLSPLQTSANFTFDGSTATINGQLSLTNASGYNVYASGAAPNYFAGAVGIGGTPNTGRSLDVKKNITGSTSAQGVVSSGTIQSDVTSQAYEYWSYATTAAAAFTLTSLQHFRAEQGALGAGSVVTNQYGFVAESSLVGATNNYGFYSNIASGTGRYNFYAAGTADNYFAGKVGVGTTTMGGVLNLATGGATDVIAALGGTFPALTYRNGTGAWFHAGKHPTNDYFYIGNGGTPTSNISFTVSSSGTISLGAAPGAESLRVTPVASAVNYFELLGAATGGTPTLYVSGSDANISSVITSKGSGNVQLRTGSGNAIGLVVAHTASAVNYHQVTGSATGNAIAWSAQGSDTNINLQLSAKGTGYVQTAAAYSPNLTLTDAATVTWDTSTGQVATFTFVSTNRTMGAPTALKNGAFYSLAVIQNGGSNTLTWNSVFKWAAGAAPTLSTAAGAKDYFVFRSDGTNLYEQGRSQGVA